MRKIMTVLLSALLCAGMAIPFASCHQAADTPTDIEQGETKEAKLLYLEIAKQPDKTVYAPGERFDAKGLEVTAVYDDGTIEEKVPFTVTSSAFQYYTKGATITYKNKVLTIPVQIYLEGNREEYDVKNMEQIENSPLAGKTYYFLGSSVTYGEGAEGQSMADFLAKKHGCTAIKNAVSGTTLMVYGKDSYVTRLNADLESGRIPEKLDGFICQLSTNDKSKKDKFGEVTADDVRSPSAFDTATTFGAIEYIVATIQNEYDCPVIFYTNSYFKDANYPKMIEGLDAIQKKYHIEVLDLYRDEAFNDISKEDYARYMRDDIHPMKLGYRDWWLPAFEKILIDLL